MLKSIIALSFATIVCGASAMAGTQVFGPGSYQFAVPAGVTTISVEVVGGGGGGGASCYGPGGMGGQDIANSQNFTVTAGEALDVEVGAGDFGICGGGNGGDGGSCQVTGDNVSLAIQGGPGGQGTGGGCPACGGRGADGEVIINW